MFFIVKFGADDEQLFNPDCATKVLIHNIREKCCGDTEMVICLLDEKARAIVKTPDISSMDNASSYFTNRATYILLKCEKEGDVIRYKPLLQDPGKDLSENAPKRKLEDKEAQNNCMGILESLNIGTIGKPIKSSHCRKASRTPQPATTKQTSGGRSRKK